MTTRFVTIVTHAENMELRKDPGQIPYQLFRLAGYQSTLVTYFYPLEQNLASPAYPAAGPETILDSYPFLLTEVPGLKMKFLVRRGRGRFYERAVYEYLVNNAKEIDVLNLFHFNTENIFYGFLYKLKNPKGKIYLKLDIDLVYYRSRAHFFNTGGFKPVRIFLWHKLFFPLFFKLTHTVSAEYATGLAYFRARFKVPAKKMMLLKNGVDSDRIARYIPRSKPFDEKENAIITVGRIGSKQKNNEMLLDALSRVSLGNWKVYFIGSVTENFQSHIARFYKENPGKRDQVIFTGAVLSPEVLYEYYNKAKIFCLTSTDEGFPLSACEAAFFGNYLLLTDRIDCFDELTDYGNYGKKIGLNQVAELADCLQQFVLNAEMLRECCENMRAYALSNLSWQAIIPQLHKRLTDTADVF
jgi:glycosyltransferase involved in cell wall biosynthesis